MKRFIYLDNAATTPMYPQVADAMEPYLRASWYNPSSFYQPAQEVRRVVEACRSYLAASLGARSSEIRFTSGGTESDNAALKGLALANASKGKHVLISAFEHHAVSESAKWLLRNGFDVELVPVTKDGYVSLEAFKAALRPDTVLASIMLANNEVGTLQPIKELAQAAHANGTLFHTDAVQAFGHIPVDVIHLEVDALSVSAHKLHGPKGVGLLYVKRGVKCEPLIHGGAQERGYRAGTENVAGIVGFAAAAHVAFGSHCLDPQNPNFATFDSAQAEAAILEHSRNISALRSMLVHILISNTEGISFNGYIDGSLPGILSITIEGVSSEALLMKLDQEGVCASAGSACASGSLDPSPVLLAMGRTSNEALNTIRISLSGQNTEEELFEVSEIILDAITAIRSA